MRAEVTEQNIYSLIGAIDLVVDGMDNFETRFLINRVCVELGKPFIHAAVHGIMGELMTIILGKGPCYQCYLQTKPPEVKPLPVLGATPGIMACLEVLEAVKLLTGLGEPLVGKLLIFDGYNTQFQILTLKRSASCTVCGGKT